MNVILQLLAQVSPEQWAIAGDMLLGAVLAVPALAGVKKWMNVNRELVMLMYVLGGAFITAAVAYIKDNPEAAPWFFIPAAGSATFAIMQVLYYALWKPGKKRWAATMEEAHKLNEAKRSAAMPAEGLPTTSFQ